MMEDYQRLSQQTRLELFSQEELTSVTEQLQ